MTDQIAYPWKAGASVARGSAGTVTKRTADFDGRNRRDVLAFTSTAHTRRREPVEDTRPEPATITIVGDNRLSRELLASTLNQRDDMRAVALAEANVAVLVAAAPQVLLLDVALRNQDSLRVAAAVRQSMPGVRIIVMDVDPAHVDLVEFVNAGVTGFVLRDATIDDVVRTIRSVVAGEKVLPPRLTEALFSQVAHEPGAREHAQLNVRVHMTRREHEVVDLIGVGLSNKEIARRLNIATHTVKSHVRNVMEKLALHTRLQIAAYTHHEGSV